MNEKLNYNPFDQIAEIYNKVERIEQILESNNNVTDEEDLITIDGAVKLTYLAKQTIYQMVSDRKIPFIKRKGTKRLYFSKEKLRKWMLSGKKEMI
jgi:excisionase family DNA binding protein